MFFSRISLSYELHGQVLIVTGLQASRCGGFLRSSPMRQGKWGSCSRLDQVLHCLPVGAGAVALGMALAYFF